MSDCIRMAHGNGGRFSRELMEEHILPYFSNPALAVLHDGAQLSLGSGEIAFTTDSYVVTPPVFPGGNIGKLAVCGTVNDLTMNGAIPKYLSCGLILEEGLPLSRLDEVMETMGSVAEAAGVSIVTGDTKVVEKGAVDGLIINTAGVGLLRPGIHIGASQVKAGMDLIVSGSLGDHAVAVMGTRYGLSLPPTVKSDCAPLNAMVHAVLDEVGPAVAFLRDPTRGGLGTSLCELASQADLGILIEESKLVVHEEVQSVCQVLGYDPLYLANEGKVLLAVEKESTDLVLSIMRRFAEGAEAVKIGETLSNNKGKVGLRTAVGGIRLLDELGEDQVPRIC